MASGNAFIALCVGAVDLVAVDPWNLMHLARMLKDEGGIPAHGNQRSEWDAGSRFDFSNPEYR